MENNDKQDSWYHGTDYFFKRWVFPAPTVKTKENLIPHSFVAFAKDQHIAQDAGGVAGGLCSATLKPDTKILDLRVDSTDNQRCWNFIKSSELGCKHVLLESYEKWLAGCSSGEVLRMMTRDAAFIEDLEESQRVVKEDADVSVEQKQLAYIKVQNFTRQWIETVIGAPKALEYDAVICSEVDDRNPEEPVPSTNLYVFNEKAITPPVWISKPDGKKLLDRILSLEEAGLL